ncbi:MAG: phosphoglycerate dehydrogenase [Dehalococcoidia bacterium]
MAAKILVTESIADEGLDIMRSQGEVDVRKGLGAEELKAIIGEYEGLVVRSETKVTADVIEAGGKLQVIARAGVGVDNIDVGAATNRGIVVVNAPTGNTLSAAEHTIALMMALSRHIPQADALLKSGVWRRSDFTGVELRNKVLGILGLGNVGTAVASRARGLEMRILAYDPFVSTDFAQNLGVQLVSVDELISESDFITIHMPLTAETRGFIGDRELAMVKPSVRIINCARGGLVDEEALFKAIEEGRVAGAAVDVFTQEPTVDNILFRSSKVIVTPHLGASTAEAQTSVAVDIAQQVNAVLQGQPARYAVNAPLIPPETLQVLRPFMEVSRVLGRLAVQLVEGQVSTIQVSYEGEISNFDTTILKASVLGGLLEMTIEERVNLVNADMLAKRRGLRIVERKRAVCENYNSLITLEVDTSTGTTVVAGTVMREEPHIVRVNDYWMDMVPTGGYFLFADHRDRPGLVGQVGTITGSADINIHSMQVIRLKARGQALMVLGLDEPLSDALRRKLLAIPDIDTARAVTL